MLAFGLLAVVMFGCVVGLGTDPQIPMLIGCVIAGLIALYLGFDWEEILDAMQKGINDSMEACLILICIGIMVAVWILSGTVPTMIYYGLEVVTPQLFLPVCFLATLIIGIIVGSWGAAGTIGLAFIGIAAALDVPLGMAAGGINEMLETISIILLVMAYAGIMQHCGLMASMVEPIINRLKSLASLVGATVFSGALFNVLLPDQYPAITMSTLVYRDEFNRRGVDRAAWGNIVNSSAGITSVLVPWNTCSIYMVTILGVACVDYMGYAFFCYLYPIVVFIVAALFGRKLGWVPKDEPEPAPIEAKAEA